MRGRRENLVREAMGADPLSGLLGTESGRHRLCGDKVSGRDVPIRDHLVAGFFTWQWRIVERVATPEFIKTLRAKIGTALLHVPTVSVLAYDDQGRLLLVQDKPSGLWGAPGGIVDPYELPSDAAVREVWEEAGVYVELTQLLGVFAGERFSVRYPNGDLLSGVETVFAASVITGMPRADQEETSDAGFFDPGKIERLGCYAHFLEIHRAVSQRQVQPYFKPATWCPPCV